MNEEFTLRKCIELAVATEEAGAKFYARLANRFHKDEKVAEIFARLAKDEEIHRRQFGDLLNSVAPEEDISASPEEYEYLKAMFISEFFSKDRGPFKGVDSIENKDDALGYAFQLEKMILGFYQAVRDTLGESDVLSGVIDAEKGHITGLMKVMISGGKFRSLQDSW